MTTFSITLRVPKSEIPKPTLTPKMVQLSHVIKIILYLRDVVDLPPTEYVITDVPARQGSLSATVSLIVATMAQVGVVIERLVDATGNTLESAINGASGIIGGIRNFRWIRLPLNGVCYVA